MIIGPSGRNNARMPNKRISGIVTTRVQFTYAPKGLYSVVDALF
jgi:hypothetical protein